MNYSVTNIILSTHYLLPDNIINTYFNVITFYSRHFNIYLTVKWVRPCIYAIFRHHFVISGSYSLITKIKDL